MIEYNTIIGKPYKPTLLHSLKYNTIVDIVLNIIFCNASENVICFFQV